MELEGILEIFLIQIFNCYWQERKQQKTRERQNLSIYINESIKDMVVQTTSTRSLLRLYYHTNLIEKIAFILIFQQNVPKVTFIGMSFFFILVNVRFGSLECWINQTKAKISLIQNRMPYIEHCQKKTLPEALILAASASFLCIINSSMPGLLPVLRKSLWGWRDGSATKNLGSQPKVYVSLCMSVWTCYPILMPFQMSQSSSHAKIKSESAFIMVIYDGVSPVFPCFYLHFVN